MLRVLDLERTSTRRVFGSTLAPIVVIFPSKTLPGNAFSVTCNSWPTRKAGLSGFRNLRKHPHEVGIDDNKRRRRIPGLHE